MTVKYHCRKCGKRFVDWGAEKLGFKCPDCEGEELVRVGSPDDKAAKRPSLKRKPRRIAPAVPIGDEEDFGGVEALEDVELEDTGLGFAAEDDEVEEEADFVDEEDVIPVAEEEETEDVLEEGEFGGVTPSLADEDMDETAPEPDDEWPA